MVLAPGLASRLLLPVLHPGLGLQLRPGLGVRLELRTCSGLESGLRLRSGLGLRLEVEAGSCWAGPEPMGVGGWGGRLGMTLYPWRNPCGSGREYCLVPPLTG